jgi:hypothetical protein
VIYGWNEGDIAPSYSQINRLNVSWKMHGIARL